MALDIAEKRAASLHYGRPFTAGIIPPTGVTSNVRRGAALGLYWIVPADTFIIAPIDFTAPTCNQSALTMQNSVSTLHLGDL